MYGRRLNSVETAITYIDTNGERLRYNVIDSKAEMGYVAEIGTDYFFNSSLKKSINIRLGFSKALMDFNLDTQSYFNQTSYVKLGFAF